MTALNKQALKPGLYAILFRNNWDGEGDTYEMLASLDTNLIWHNYETGKELFEYEGDEIIKSWLLNDCTTTDALEAAEKHLAELEGRAFNPAILDVIAERQRQKTIEGWTPEHDDQYGKSQLLWASSCYLLNTIQPFNRIPMDWPWDSSWWKPTNPRRDLVKAGALIIAEIERIDRAAGIGVKWE